MEYRRLGSTGLKISCLGLGCGNFGGVGSAPEFYGMGENEAQAFELMDRAWDAGINFFDTADAYGGGRSETFIGRWLKAKGSRARDQLLLSSKVFNPVGPGPNDRGLSRRHILRQVDASLARLQTDRLDMYLIHEPDPDTPLDETMQALDDLVRAGKVLYIGASNIEAWRLARSLWISDQRAAGPLRVGAELLQPPGPCAGARAVPALRRSGRGIHGVQPAGRRMADGQVSERRSVSGGLADDAAAGAVPAPGGRRRVSSLDGARDGRRVRVTSR